MGRIDHQPARLAKLARQFGENHIEHAQTTPAKEPIVDHIIRNVLALSIAPAQPIPDDKTIPLIIHWSSRQND